MQNVICKAPAAGSLYFRKYYHSTWQSQAGK